MAQLANIVPDKNSPVLRLLLWLGGLLLLALVSGYIGVSIVKDEEKPFYQPGVIPSREECFIEKLSRYSKLTKQILFQAGQECELEIQSIEGHEQRRIEWLQEQAEKRRLQKEAPPPEAPAPAAPIDTVRRVWR
ncbi:hypothetical protein [Ferrovibrio sp.]|uniref:hypothetical protein n=1 Tax=Ferrovibrio sp. TaxID=1917215 RepID=UPI001B658A64|nr:hypothetical protein [Ferrovibrio sp.]MBP7064210.1 hypothetical protein [Ferrovibrio sp.]